jgi:hypothetical protein
MLAEGCGEERGDATASSFGDWVLLSSRMSVCPVTIFRFLVEAVVEVECLP